jgi:FkbM family methyltransferase
MSRKPTYFASTQTRKLCGSIEYRIPLRHTMSSVSDAPRQVMLPALYRLAMKITRRHGQGTLSRINHRMFPKGQIVRLATGAEFFVPPDPHFFGYIVAHEKHITRVIADEVKAGDTCLDVGANIGYFAAAMASRCGPSGRVVAYEPEAANFAMLTTNAKLAEARGLKVETVRAAVSDCAGTLALVRGEQSTLHQVASAGTATRPEDLVPCVNLADDLRARGINGPIRLLKIDVEGHEVAVLKGCTAMLAEGRVGTVIIEVTEGAQAAEIDAILKRLNVDVTCWLDCAWRDIPVAKLPYRTDIMVRFRGAKT